MSQQRPERLTKGGRFWALVPFALIGSMLLGLGSLAYLAVDDPSFAIEKDYYRKAVAWDESRAQSAQNAALGWKVELETEPEGDELRVVARLKDRNGTPIEGAAVSLEAFANARASRIVSARLSSADDASYRGRMALIRPGLWEFRFSVEQGGQRFTAVLRQQVAAGGAS